MELGRVKSILIIDDEPDVREAIKDSLVAIDADFLEAWDGTAALTLLNRMQVDLIICDFNMPTMNGIEFLKTLKERDRVVPPFIMITGRSSASLYKEAWDLGTNQFLEKPFAPEKLSLFAEELLKYKSTQSDWDLSNLDTKVLKEKNLSEIKVLLKRENVKQLKSYCEIFGVSMSSQIDLLIEEFLRTGSKK